MQIDDEALMAFADGQLTGPEAEAVAAAVSADPALAEKVAEHRRLNETLAQAFNPVLDAPVPPAMLRAAAATPDSNVASMADARARKAERPAGRRARLFGGQWGAIAAALAAGVIAGHVLSLDRGLVREKGGTLVARTALAEALDEQLASDDPAAANSPVRIGLTFRNNQDQYCRTFAAAYTSSMSGIACRHDGDWEIRLAAAADPLAGTQGYRQAGSDAALITAAQAMMKGDPLDAQQEARARARTWR